MKFQFENGRVESCNFVANDPSKVDFLCGKAFVTSTCRGTCKYCGANARPSPSPTWRPSLEPTRSPIASPTDTPTGIPSVAPIVVPTMVPSLSLDPSSRPTVGCIDSESRFKQPGTDKYRLCAWVARLDTVNRCALPGVATHCPVTCDACDRL